MPCLGEGTRPPWGENQQARPVELARFPDSSMHVRQIILASGIFLAVSCAASGQQPALIPPPTTYQQPTALPPVITQQPPGTPPTPASAAPVMIDGQQYAPATPIVVQPTPQSAVVYPPGSTVVPLPSQAPGSIFGPPIAPSESAAQPPGVIVPEQLPAPPGAIVPAAPGAVPMQMPGPIPGAVVVPGVPGVVPGQTAGGPGNTISVPVVDDDQAWDQISDVVSDYFKIAREQRARRGTEGWCEGRIDTMPQDGATWLEPWRQDSVGAFNRWESTFQSIRRKATVRVIPDANGYLVEVAVEKEIEDLPRPEKATAGAAAFSTDITLPSNRLEEVSRLQQSPRWLALGRDAALEQRMLAEIHARLNGVTTRGSVFATATRSKAGTASAAKR